MKKTVVGSLIIALVFAFSVTLYAQEGTTKTAEYPPKTEEAQEAEATPAPEDAWWPSPWGPDDEIGATNRITPTKVLSATELIVEGQIYELGRPYEANMPVFGGREFSLRTLPPGGPFGENGVLYHDKYLATEIGQVGTQLDAIGHIGLQLGDDGDNTQIRYYNGFSEHEIGGMYGLRKLGVHNVKPIFTRGTLIDVAALKERMLEEGEEITLDDVLAALERQGLSEEDIHAGDVVLFHTGWGSLWQVDNARYIGAMPGIGLEVAGWLVDKGIVLVGTDTLVVEVVPNPDPTLAFPAHGELIAKNGIHLHENLDLSQLAADEVYQFAYIFVRLPIVGGTGSPGIPLAVR